MQAFILIILLEKIASQWLPYQSYLISNKFYKEATGDKAYNETENFFKPLTSYTTANFINCSSPATSYITLDQGNLETQNYFQFSLSQGQVISFDLYFHGRVQMKQQIYTWNNQFVTMKIGSFSETNYYTSPNTYFLTSGFCNTTPYEVQTFNYQLISSISGTMSIKSSNNIGGMVSIKNIFISKLKCYPSCQVCNGPAFNQCQSCYYGAASVNICPACPINQYYVKFMGCRDCCDFQSKLFKNKFCQEYIMTTFTNAQIQNIPFYVENLKWSINYDKNHIDTTVGLKQIGYSFYGIFKYNSGIQRFVNEIWTDVGTKLIGLKIVILIFGLIPMESGINFKLIETLNFIDNLIYLKCIKPESPITTHTMVPYLETLQEYNRTIFKYLIGFQWDHTFNIHIIINMNYTCLLIYLNIHFYFHPPVILLMIVLDGD